MGRDGAGHFTVTWHASGGPALLRIHATSGAAVGSVEMLGGDSYCDHAPMTSEAGTLGLVEVWAARPCGTPGSRCAAASTVWTDVSLGKSEVFFSRLTANAAPSGIVIRVSPL